MRFLLQTKRVKGKVVGGESGGGKKKKIVADVFIVENKGHGEGVGKRIAGVVSLSAAEGRRGTAGRSRRAQVRGEGEHRTALFPTRRHLKQQTQNRVKEGRNTC